LFARTLTKENAVKKALNVEQVAMIHTLRRELDCWGEPKWSGEYIAQQIGVSESTVWRVLRKRAAYAPEVGEKRMLALEMDTLKVLERADPEMEKRAAESLARVLAGQNKAPTWGDEQLTDAARTRLALFRDVAQAERLVDRPTAVKRVPPPSPLDGGGGGIDETAGTGVAALGTAKASVLVDNARGLLGHNARELS
jgi:hypothetical protein